MGEDGRLHWVGVAWQSAWATHRELIAVDAEAAHAWCTVAPAAPGYQAALRTQLPRAAFVGRAADGRPLVPRRGRFYPARCLATDGLPAPSAWPPPRVFRVFAAAGQITVDANSPLAGVPLAALAECWPAHPACRPAGGGEPLAALLAAGIGLQVAPPIARSDVAPEVPPGPDGAVVTGGRHECAGDSVFFAAGHQAASDADAAGPAAGDRAAAPAAHDFAHDFARADAAPDRDFYRQPRLVQHIDVVAQQVLATMHAAALDGLPAPARVLDLMSGWATHLPADRGWRVCGLGLNGAELAANARLAERCIADLNARPALPFADASFDAAICALSIEYLVDPLAVFRELARVLRPGAPCLVSWSERWFPPKAIRLWAELHPYERVALVIDGFRLSGGWRGIASESRRGLRRPPEDRYAGRLPHADPLYCVVARRADG